MGILYSTLVTGFPAASSFTGAEAIPVVQGGANRKATASAFTNDLNVKHFGAVGDGTTSDQAALVAAFAAAASAGKHLYFPPGTYVSTATVPSFHAVRKTGPGIVLAGATTFTVSPGSAAVSTNVLYVSPTGVDTNDGLHSDRPVKTEQRAFDILQGYGPVLAGFWQVRLAAGTYNGEVTFPENLRGLQRVSIQGPVVNHPNVPTAILDGAGTRSFGINFNGGNKVKISNILARNFTTYGIVAQDMCDLYTENFHGTSVGTGIKVQQGRIRVSGGIIRSSQYGMTFISGTTFTVGEGASSLATGPQILNCTVAGVLAQESSDGHVDYTTIDNCVIGADININSRIHFATSTVKNNTGVGVQARASSSWLNNGSTFTGNAVNFKNLSYSLELNKSAGAQSQLRTVLDLTPVAHTGTTTQTTLKTYAAVLAADSFNYTGRTLRVVINGNFTGTSGTKTLRVLVGNGLAHGLVSVPSSVGVFRYEGLLHAITASTQAYSVTMLDSSSSVVKADLGSRAIATSTGAGLAVVITGELSIAGESINIHSVEIWEVGA